MKSFRDSIDKKVFPFPCPKCKRKIRKSIGQLKTNPLIACVCGTQIECDLSQFLPESKKMDKAFGKLEKSLKKLEKSF